MEQSPKRRANIRRFKPDDPQGHEFIYGKESAEVVEREIRRLTASELFVIVNETVDVNDGGVSGVVHADIMEFAPGATPRVVVTGQVVSASRTISEVLLETVYGFRPALPKGARNLRVEFSIHPVRRGVANEHTIIWEAEEVPIDYEHIIPKWPNDFSRFIGDKTFGLLVANVVGLRVPRTTMSAALQ